MGTLRCPEVRTLLTRDDVFRSLILLMVLLSGLGLWTIYIHLPFTPERYYDFPNYYHSAVAYRTSGSLYDNRFVYPPFAILFFLPLSFLPLQAAFFAFLGLNLLLLVIIAVLITRILRFYQPETTIPLFAFVFLFLIFFQPVSQSLTCGQANILVVFLLVLFYEALFIREKPGFAAICLSLATLIKLFPAYLVFCGILTDRARQFIRDFIICSGVLWGAALLWFGVENHRTFLKVIVEFFDLKGPHPPLDLFHPSFPRWPERFVNPFNTVRKLLAVSHLNDYYPVVSWSWMIISCLIAILALFFLFRMIRNMGPSIPREWPAIIFSFQISLVLLLSKGTEQYHAIFLVLPIFLLLYALRLTIAEKILLLTSLLLICSRSYIEYVGRITGGLFQSLVYIFHPQMIGYCVFFILMISIIITRSRERSPKHESHDSEIPPG